MKQTVNMRLRSSSGGTRQWTSVIILLALVLIFSLRAPSFFSLTNLFRLLYANVAIMIVVCGLAIVMTGGGIDLSIGYQISLVSGVLSVLFMEKLPTPLIVGAGLLAGALCGLINGLLVSYAGIVPFAATIATQVIFRGLSYLLTEDRVVTALPRSFRAFTRNSFLAIRLDEWVAIALIAALTALFRVFYFGKYVRAIGLNEDAAAHAGIPVRRVRCLTYCIAGVLYAAAAIVLCARSGQAGSNVGPGMEITAITAAYIGGVQSIGKNSNPLWLMVGVLIVAVLDNGLRLMGGNANEQYIFTGLILITSMWLYRMRDAS